MFFLDLFGFEKLIGVTTQIPKGQNGWWTLARFNCSLYCFRLTYGKRIRVPTLFQSLEKLLNLKKNNGFLFFSDNINTMQCYCLWYNLIILLRLTWREKRWLFSGLQNRCFWMKPPLIRVRLVITKGAKNLGIGGVLNSVSPGHHIYFTLSDVRILVISPLHSHILFFIREFSSHWTGIHLTIFSRFHAWNSTMVPVFSVLV